MKKLATLLCLVALLIMSATPVWAGENRFSGNSLNPAGIESYQLIKVGYSSIQDNLDGTITLYGYTRTYYPVDRIGIIFNLQYYNGSNWVTIKTIPFESQNSSDITKTVTMSVSRGYTYRLLTEHYAADGSVYESGTSVTGSIIIK